MITEKQLIEMGFTPMFPDDYKFYQKQLTSDDYLVADEFENGWEVTVGEIVTRLYEASDVKQIIDIFNKAKNGTS